MLYHSDTISCPRKYVNDRAYQANRRVVNLYQPGRYSRIAQAVQFGALKKPLNITLESTATAKYVSQPNILLDNVVIELGGVGESFPVSPGSTFYRGQTVWALFRQLQTLPDQHTPSMG